MLTIIESLLFEIGIDTKKLGSDAKDAEDPPQGSRGPQPQSCAGVGRARKTVRRDAQEPEGRGRRLLFHDCRGIAEAQDLLESSTGFKLKFIEELLLNMALAGGTEFSGDAFMGLSLVVKEARQEVEKVTYPMVAAGRLLGEFQAVTQ